MNAYSIAELLWSMAKQGEDGTVRRLGGSLPVGGYYVGGKVPSLVFNSPEEVDRGELAWWIGNNPSTYYGVWVDSASAEKKVYIDAVTHVNFREYAESVGRTRGELTIWDIANSTEIRLDEESAA